MSEADLTEQLLTISELVLLMASVSFTMISAYIVGLYWFIRQSSVLMKVIAFSIFTLTLLPLVIIGFGLYRHNEGVSRALVDLNQTEALSPLGAMAIEEIALGVGDSVAAGLVIVGLLIYLGMFYITFFHKWPTKS